MDCFEGRPGQRNRIVSCRTITSNGVPVASNEGECVCLHGYMSLPEILIAWIHVIASIADILLHVT